MNLNEETVSVILPIHNQQEIIGKVVTSILDCNSVNVKEMIIILDGCTDNTKEEVLKIFPFISASIIILETPDLNEVKVNNVGLKMVKHKYSLLIQDDMVIKEKDFDKVLMKPFGFFDNLLGVSGRDAVDIRLVNGKVDFYNVAGKDVKTPKQLFCIRDIINRGPILVDNKKMKELNYFDEMFAPIGQDDSDLCLRAYRKGWIVGAYGMDYDSEPSWSFSRRDAQSHFIRELAEVKNLQELIDRHTDLITAPKHTMDITIF